MLNLRRISLLGLLVAAVVPLEAEPTVASDPCSDVQDQNGQECTVCDVECPNGDTGVIVWCTDDGLLGHSC